MYVPTTPGEAWGGGYYAGRMKVNDQAYAVVVAPYASGVNDSVQLTTGSVPSGLSLWDGNANHEIFIAAGLSNHPAAQWCNALSIGGFTDWHIPADKELDICYRAFRPANAPSTSYGDNPYADPPKGNYTSDDPPATTLPDWVTGGSEAFIPNYYMTSSQNGSLSSAVIVNFNGGIRVNTNATDRRTVRATRLVKVYD